MRTVVNSDLIQIDLISHHIHIFYRSWKMTDTICSSSDEEEILTYKLKIHDANFSDSGKWKCEVKDKYGSVSTACDINVYGKSESVNHSPVQCSYISL